LELGALLELEGYEAYEMTAFARPGHESRHASAVLAGAPYLGLGPGATSRIGGRVRQNSRNWLSYEGSVGQDPPEGPFSESDPVGPAHFVLSPDDALVRMHDQLRLREGLPVAALTSAGRRIGRRWVELGWAHSDPDRLRLRSSGWLRLDALAIELDRAGGVEEWEGLRKDCGEDG
jgi:coproporphyrinogen III oxidase-like Fe-S oxidoreductase